MKKIFSAFLLIVTMVLLGVQNNFVNAQDVYLGVYEDGRTAYLMDETIKYYRDYKGEYIVGEGYTCRVKSVNSSNNVKYIDYKWQYGPQTEVLYKNGNMYLRQELNRLYQNPSHPEMVLIYKLKQIWKQRMG